MAESSGAGVEKQCRPHKQSVAREARLETAGDRSATRGATRGANAGTAGMERQLGRLKPPLRGGGLRTSRFLASARGYGRDPGRVA